MSSNPTNKTLTIRGHFHGFLAGSLFHLSDDTIWLQTEKLLWRFHSDDQQVLLIQDDSGFYLQLPDQDFRVAVEQVSEVMLGRIKDDFHGWDGETAYQLTNDQVWQQVDGAEHIQNAYMPHVVIYAKGGQCFMQVMGRTVQVRRAD
jgi:hypothetical protein